jgi:cysteine desulfurase
MPFWNSFGVAKEFDIQVDFVAVKSNGEIDLTHLEELLAQDVKSLVSLMHVNNEIGTVLDLHRVGVICRTPSFISFRYGTIYR